jgi:hypothetical protein
MTAETTQMKKPTTKPEPPMRCDWCGRFISYDDLEKGYAVRRLTCPDSEFTCEEYETACPTHR